MDAGVLSESLLCRVDGHVVVVAAYRQVRLQGDGEKRQGRLLGNFF